MTISKSHWPVTELPDPEYLPKRSVGERVAHGHGLRADLPHQRQAAWSPPRNRADPLAILARQSAERIAELIPIRYGRMAASQFAFFRGAAAVMAADLAGTPTAGLNAQLCGDAHLLNFGMFDTPERALVFGLNDFDETLPGPARSSGTSSVVRRASRSRAGICSSLRANGRARCSRQYGPTGRR